MGTSMVSTEARSGQTAWANGIERLASPTHLYTALPTGSTLEDLRGTAALERQSCADGSLRTSARAAIVTALAERTAII